MNILLCLNIPCGIFGEFFHHLTHTGEDDDELARRARFGAALGELRLYSIL